MATPSFVGASEEVNANIINQASLQLEEGNDPDKVEVLEELENIQDSNPVYRPCSVSVSAINANGSNSLKQLPQDCVIVNNIKTPNTNNGNGNDNEAAAVDTEPGPRLKQAEKSKSSWSLSRMFRNPLFACCACRQAPENQEESSDGGGIELQNLIEPGPSLPARVSLA